MAHDPGPPPLGLRAYLRPWPMLLVGLGLTVAGLVQSVVPFPLLQALLPAAGLLLGGVAISRHLKGTKWDFPDRLESAALIGVLGVMGAVSYFALDADWDSGRMFCAVVVLGSTLGSLLVLLPTLGRRIALSVLVLFHFLGIVVTVTASDPGPWWSKQLYMRVYRPYLTFIYMTNQYHFYSPEPGAAPLLWFAVHYSDGTYKWLKLPERESSPIGMHYQRMLALPQHAFTPMARMPYNDFELATPVVQDLKRKFELKVKDDKRIKPILESWQVIARRRELGSSDPGYKPYRIPVVTGWAENAQYNEPADGSKFVLSAMAKYVFHHPPPPDTEGAVVTSVKVYWVRHSVLSPAELARGVSPLHKNKYIPYFVGEFNGEGDLLNPYDPFLYWYLPIVMVPKNYEQPAGQPIGINVVAPEPSNGKWLDCLEIHAARPFKVKAEQNR